ncbi:MAG: sn-glycerol-3-phosphate ABC transporter ATP-binding protein UgpC [Burkholderiaceae bacterium]|nr:sn-glycerol-3-phosphate ABC transporter ATP-binding protein UgpC [Burkholderiaceae bacterium]
MAELRIEGVHKHFGDTRAISGVDLSVGDGEFCVLVGPSGCGKSTLLRLIAGLEEISQGHVWIGSRDVNDLAPKERDIAMVFGNSALYPHMKVFANMAFGLGLAGADRAEIDARVGDAARVLDLSQLLERLPRQLSGGHRQQVAIGRAIVRKPQVFLFDDPLSSLDAKLRARMRVEIRELHRRLKTTSIYVTSDQAEAMTMADRIVVMHGGIVEQTGSPRDLYDRPANTFVAGYIGSPAMNQLRARVGIDGASVDIAEATIPVPDWHAPPGTEAVLGVRPEHLALGDDGIRVQVSLVEAIGADTLVSCESAAGPLVARLRERRALRPGDRITLAPRPRAMHVFDADSGKRI